MYEVRNEDIERKLKDIGSIIGLQIPKGYGFTLMIFNYGEGGGMFYISSAERASMIESMKEFIEKNEVKDVEKTA